MKDRHPRLCHETVTHKGLPLRHPRVNVSGTQRLSIGYHKDTRSQLETRGDDEVVAHLGMTGCVQCTSNTSPRSESTVV